MTEFVEIRPDTSSWPLGFSTYTWDNFSWNRIKFQSAELWFKSDESVADTKITIFGRQENGSIDTTNMIVAEFETGNHVKLTVKVDGLLQGEETTPWTTINDSIGQGAGAFGVFADNYTVSCAVWNRNNATWYTLSTFYYSQMSFPPSRDNTVPSVTVAAPSDVDRFYFGEFILGVAPQNPTDPGTPNDPINIKDFEVPGDYWRAHNPNNPELPDWYFFRVEGQTAHFEYHSWSGDIFQQPFRIPELQGVMWKLTQPYEGPTWEIGVVSAGGLDNAYIAGGEGLGASARWTAGEEYGSVAADSGSGAVKFFRIFRRNNRLTMEASIGGTTWERLITGEPMANPTAEDFVLSLSLNGFNDIINVHGITVPPDDDPTWNPPAANDPDTDARAPETNSGSATILDLVREFSGAVKQAVRITGPNSIAMVDPDVPLPAGMLESDGAGMYSASERTIGAETSALSVKRGKASLAVSCQVVTNDVRVLHTTWRIPDRLPVYGLAPTMVKRVTYTFTPATFEASMDFHYLSARLRDSFPTIDE